MDLLRTRTAIEVLLEEQASLATDLEVDTSPVEEIRYALQQGEISVAVVGEVNRGKSTFLNALLGAKVFPSRVSVCTAGITLLENGDPGATVVYRNGKTKEIEVDPDDPATTLASIVSRQNEDVQSVEAVRIRYPNPFTRNGIVLVDTPGVNDPESWREDITYNYLANADAVVMLLDPLQPLSASEVEFLTTKILKRSISSLLFVVNKIDDVRLEDREHAVGRVRRLLSEYVPNPTIYTVAAKPALAAKLAEDDDRLRVTGLPAFEEGLHAFLAKGRGGVLLQTKIQKSLNHLATVESGIAARLGALDSHADDVRRKVQRARDSLRQIESNKDRLAHDLDGQRKSVKSRLTGYLDGRKEYLAGSLKPTTLSEPDPAVLRERVLTFQRDTIEEFRAVTEKSYAALIEGVENASTQLAGDVLNVLGNVRRQADNEAAALTIERGAAGQTNSTMAGAVVGGTLGAAAGAGLAATATTTAVYAVPTVYGAVYGVATTAAFSTAGIIGIGVLTGGLGLLLGLGAAALLAGRKKDEGGYVGGGDVTNNKAAAAALDRFVNGLEDQIDGISKALVHSAKAQALAPVEQAARDQHKTINQVESDLSRTVEEQESIRVRLRSAAAQANGLRAQFTDLMSN